MAVTVIPSQLAGHHVKNPVRFVSQSAEHTEFVLTCGYCFREFNWPFSGAKRDTHTHSQLLVRMQIVDMLRVVYGRQIMLGL